MNISVNNRLISFIWSNAYDYLRDTFVGEKNDTNFDRSKVARFPADTDQIVLLGEPVLLDTLQMSLYYQTNRINFTSSEQGKI